MGCIVTKKEKWFVAKILEPMTIPELIKLLEGERDPKVKQYEDRRIDASFLHYDEEVDDFWTESIFDDDVESSSEDIYETDYIVEDDLGGLEIWDLYEGYTIVELDYDMFTGFKTKGDELTIDYDKIDCLIKVLRTVEKLHADRQRIQ